MCLTEFLYFKSIPVKASINECLEIAKEYSSKKSNVFINVGIQYILHNQDKYIIKNIEKVNVGSIPIMIHSKLCLLHNLDPIKLSDLGECPYDQGGYFIINGKEKVILSQEKMFLKKLN